MGGLELACIFTTVTSFIMCLPASAETYYVTPKSSTPCPEEGVSCLTLSQYALEYFASNTTLILLPGNHSLDSDFHFTNMTYLAIVSESSVENTTVTVTCNPSTMVTFEYVSYLQIREITFHGCVNNTISSVDMFELEECYFNGQGRNGSGLKMYMVTDANILSSSFESNTGSEAADPFSSSRVIIGGGGIHVVNSNISISNTLFENNTADLGGAVLCENSSISINNCSFFNNFAIQDGGGLYTSYSTASINHTWFINNSAIKPNAYAGAVQILLNSTSAIENSMFINNSAGYGGGAVDIYKAHKNCIKNTVFIQNRANIGSAIFVESSSLVSSDVLNISNNTANSSAVYILNSTVSLTGEITICNNYGTVFAFASNLTFAGYTEIMNNSKDSTSQMVHQEGGSVTCFQSQVVFIGTTQFMFNTAKHGGAISTMESKIYLYGIVDIVQNTASSSGGGIYAYQSELTFKGNATLCENTALKNGGAISAVGSTVRFVDGNLLFANNHAKNGGGICLELNSKLYVLKPNSECINGEKCVKHNPETWQRLEFTNNSAKYGGALYVSDTSNSGTCDATPFRAQSTAGECFLQALALHPTKDDDLNLVNIYFTKNSATIVGSSIFGGLLDRCTVSPFAELFQLGNYTDLSSETLDAISYFLNITNIKREDLQSEISSDPVRVCFCKNNQPDCSYEPPTVFVWKGETFNVSLVAVNQMNETIPYTRIHNSLSSQVGRGDGRSVRNTNESCTALEYSILSPYDSENLLLHASGPCKDTGISKTTISVMFKDCPIGFRDSKLECECDPILYPEFVTNCSIDNKSVLRKKTVWISLLNNSNIKGYTIYQNCPFDYCYPASEDIQVNLNIPNGADVQCAFNRSGKLCGACKDGLSLTLGSSRCTQCSNKRLALIILFAIAGVALVVFLLVFNLTVAVGTINGLIFYANIIVANRAIFFPFQPNFLTIFIAWLNLDFGIETCFYNGMDSYAKVWLQLVFPTYILLLVAIVMLFARCSPAFSKLLSNRNPVATLDTLILLSYAKLVRTIYAILSFARLEQYTKDGEIKRVVVWLIDPNIRYFEGKHIPLFITALLVLLVGLVYTFFMFLWQWLLRCPNKKCLRWIRNVKLNAFMDAYHAPYNKRHRYWTGLLLLVRAFLYLEASIDIVNEVRNTLLAIVCIVVGICLVRELLKDRVYRRWPLNALESSFLFNLILFATATLYIRETGGNQVVLANISTSIAFLTFSCILVYHAFANIKSLQKLRDSVMQRWNQKIFRAPSEQVQSCNAYFKNEQSDEFSELREPLDMFDHDRVADDYFIIKQSSYKPPVPTGVTHSVVDAIPSSSGSERN